MVERAKAGYLTREQVDECFKSWKAHAEQGDTYNLVNKMYEYYQELRSEMLRIYYHNREREVIRQYEYENFVILYEAYKALKGNSFIDKIYSEVKNWEIVI